MLTIFTPTYNRKKELARLYQSLKEQTNKKFEWIIVDDGSTEDIASVVKAWQEESNEFEIVFVRQENAGKMQAHNVGVEKARYDIFMCVDSDDWLVEDAIENIYKYWDQTEAAEVAGMVFLDKDGNTGNVIGTNFPKDNLKTSFYDIYAKYNVLGDKHTVFKTSILKQYEFPKYTDEKFVPEALVYNRISKKYTVICKNIVIKNVEYMSDGYSKNYFEHAKKSPMAHRQYFLELYDFKQSMYNVYGYVLYSLIAKMSLKEIIKRHKAKFKVVLVYPVAWIKYVRKGR